MQMTIVLPSQGPLFDVPVLELLLGKHMRFLSRDSAQAFGVVQLLQASYSLH